MRISLLGLLLVLTPAVARAGPIINLTGYNTNGGSFTHDAVQGFRFDVPSGPGIIVTHLGVYDYNGDGLAGAHEVGLWNSSGTPLASGTVAAGETPTLDAYFRLVDIADVFLPSGTGYQVGAWYEYGGPDAQDFGRWLDEDMSVSPLISFDSTRFANSATLTPPTSDNAGSYNYFGASFNANAVPEPSTLAALAGLLGMGLIGRWWRRRKIA